METYWADSTGRRNERDADHEVPAPEHRGQSLHAPSGSLASRRCDERFMAGNQPLGSGRRRYRIVYRAHSRRTDSKGRRAGLDGGKPDDLSGGFAGPPAAPALGHGLTNQRKDRLRSVEVACVVGDCSGLVRVRRIPDASLPQVFGSSMEQGMERRQQQDLSSKTTRTPFLRLPQEFLLRRRGWFNRLRSTGFHGTPGRGSVASIS